MLVTPRARLPLTWQGALLASAFLLLWFEVINHLRQEWEINPQYSYGWTVPFLGLFLLYKRWQHRPAAGAPAMAAVTIALVALTALPLLPARIISIANPDWRLLSWTLSFCGVALTLSAFNLAGGARWLRHFAFPVFFFLVATPWPAQFEQAVVQRLMRADAAIVIEMLNAIGTVAIQRGNVIELSTGLVGIDDACTGVRSLQATFMVALFLGEFYLMTIGRRVFLVVAAALLAFVCNLARTLLLCLVAAHSGNEAIHSWHDPAGFTILSICLVGLWLISLWLIKGRPDQAPAALIGREFSVRRLSRLAAVLAVWIVFVEVATAAWYHVRGADLLSTPAWSVAFPTAENEYKPTEVAAAARDLLRYNDGGGASWAAANGRHFLLYYFRWLPGRTAALFVKVHRPDVCLPASGLTLREDAGIHPLEIHGINLPIHRFRFEAQGQPLHIFYCYWDSRSSYRNAASSSDEDWSMRGRLRAAWFGRREMGSQMVELVVAGYDDDEAAWAALTEQMQRLVHRTDP